MWKKKKNFKGKEIMLQDEHITFGGLHVFTLYVVTML